MKKLLLLMVTVVAGYAAYGQTVVAGVSPASIQGNYDFGFQANCGLWPGESDDGTWGDWGILDFNNPGDHIQGELMLVEDGTPGTNTQGNPISQEGCNPLTNNLTGKIAVVYRNTCWFSSKVYYAEQAGAIGVIVVNRENDVINMAGNTDPQNGPLGIDCHIPAVFISNIDGDILVAEMANGPVEMFIGNKLGAYGDDIGSVKGEYLIAPYAGANNRTFDGLQPGIQVYNYGANDQTDVTINARIDGPNGNYYDETVGPFAMLSGDTLAIFPGDPSALPVWSEGGAGNYDDGDYTLTYTLEMTGVTDENSFDNVYTVDFKVQGDVLSYARLDGNNMPLSSSYPSNATTDYNSCMFVEEANGSAYAVDGIWFVPHADTSVEDISGTEIFGAIYEWNDAWVDAEDPTYWGVTATANPWANIDLVTFGYAYPNSNDEVDDPAFLEFQTQIQLQDNQRYLFCVNTTEVDKISFGYDGGIDYNANRQIYAMPNSVIKIDTTWYRDGWIGSNAPSIAISTFDPQFIGLTETTPSLEISAYPNPTNDLVYFGTKETGEGVVLVNDLTGKLVAEHSINFDGSLTSIDIAALEAGVYMFNITMKDGRATTFNVVKH